MSSEGDARRQAEQRRSGGPLLPRPDLVNRSPEDDGDGDGSIGMTSKVTSGGSRPPQHGKRKQRPVKSSSRGSIVKAKGLGGRPSAPIVIERRPSSSSSRRSLPASSPANSVGSSSSCRSSRRSLSGSDCRLRHGDGTLFGSIDGGGGGKNASRFDFKKPDVAKPPKAAGKPEARSGGKGNGGDIQWAGPRAPSPVARSLASGPAPPSTGVAPEATKKARSSRAPGPAPAAAKRPHARDGGVDDDDSATKNLKVDPRAGPASTRRGSRAPSPAAASSVGGSRGPPPRLGPEARRRASIDGAARRRGGGPGTPPRRRPSAGRTDASDDPTPVKEARRLSSLFKNRASMLNRVALALDGGTPPSDDDETAPKKEGDRSDLPCAAAPAVAASPSLPATESVRSSDAVGDGRASLEGRDDPGRSETALLSADIFSRQSGIDADNVRRILSMKCGENIKQWDLRKRLEKKEEELAVLRTTCQDLLAGKEDYVAGVVGIEKGLRERMAEAQRALESLNNEKSTLEEELKEEKSETRRLKKRVQELLRERDQHSTKCEMLSSELDAARREVGELQRSRTEGAVALALAESRLEESESRREAALADAAETERIRAREAEEAVAEARSEVAAEMGERLKVAGAENDALRAEARARRAREVEVCRLLGVDVSSAEVIGGDADDGATDSFLSSIERRLGEFQNESNAKEEVEKDLEACRDEMEKVKADYAAALEAVTTKDRDMSDITKSVDNIRRSNQDREEELAGQRKAAEDRAAEAEGRIVECREKLLSSEHERKFLEEALEASEAECAAGRQKLSGLQAENTALKSEAKARRYRDEDVCQLMGLDVELAVFGSHEDYQRGTDSILNSIKHRLEELRESTKVKERVERDLERCIGELEKAKANHQAALDTIASKDRDLSGLTKSISDIQRSGQGREQELADQRRTAEDRAVAAESQVAECRERLSSLDSERKFLEEALEASEAECAAHGSTIANLRSEISESEIRSAKHDSLRARAEEKEGEERAERVALAAQLNAQLRERARAEKQLRDSMESTERSLTDRMRRKEEESRAKDAEIDRCKETIAALEAHQLSLKRSLSEHKSMLDATNEEEIGRLRGEIANLESRLRSESEKMRSAGVASEARVRELEEALRNGRTERKRMHNIIQELRGNVRVFARIRPFLPDDGKHGEEDGSTTPFVRHEGDDVVTVTKRNDPSNDHKFSFDHVFAPSAGQEAVYKEVSEFVQSALDGYNVTLFSYGQTGSGKTHTMQGTGSGAMRGLIPRSIEQIAANQVQLKNDGWKFSMKMSFLEIYNESLRDLLRPGANEERKLEIKVDGDGCRSVTNLTVKSIDPSDRDGIKAALALAAKRRSTASTDMNAGSSRSHSVFTLNLTARHEGRNQMMRGTLNLVDLAGSERLGRSNVKGQHAKETAAINKSLSSLADVFTAISQKQAHVPFRHSKLTFLLQPSLSGDGKTLMVVNISPTEASVQESLCSLRFASKVNKCELGKAKRTVEEVTSKKGTAPNNQGSAATVEEVISKKGSAPNKRGSAATVEEVTSKKRTAPIKRGSATTVEEVISKKETAPNKRGSATTVEEVIRRKGTAANKRGSATTNSKSGRAESRNVKRKT